MAAKDDATVKPEPSQLVLILRRLIGGTAGGVLQAFSSHPFDTIKNRVQNKLYPSIGACVRGTLAKEGISGFYRGVTPPLMLSGMHNALLFSINQFMTNLLTPADHRRGDPLPMWRTAVAGQLTAPCYVFVFTPVEVVKVRLQLSGKKLYSGPIDCLTKVIRQEGPMALMSGYFPTLMTRVIGLPFYFVSYQYMRELLIARRTAEKKKDVPLYVPMLSGIVAGWAFWCTIYPLDLVKTLTQSSTQSEMKPSMIARRTYAEGGISAFYRGFPACLIRAVPANASVWMGVETTSKFMEANGW